MFDNLELKRAKNAFHACQGKSFGGKDSGEVVKKIPSMVRENGFLGALAFAIEAKENAKDKAKESNEGYWEVFNAICEHLKEIGKINAGDADAMMRELIDDSDSLKLRDVTAEALLYLNYMRRFAKKMTEGANNE